MNKDLHNSVHNTAELDTVENLGLVCVVSVWTWTGLDVYQYFSVASVIYVSLFSCSFTSDNGGGICDCPRCLSVCKILKNACMDLDEILRVDRCREMDELINF